MQHIYVSPHADDVALSCGGQIIARANIADETLIVNVFTSDGPQGGENSGDLERAFAGSIHAERATEDKAAWDSIGISAEHAELPEALLRKRFPFAILGGGDDPIIARLYDVLLRYVGRYPNAAFYFPAGIGNHVDHLACAKAALRLLDENRLEKIFLYEDIPYCWLRFLRNGRYRALAGRVQLDDESRARAFRRDGVNIVEYLRGGDVPFPRGKNLFAVLSLSQLLRNGVSGRSDRSGGYRGTVSLRRLDDATVARKKDLLFHYHSQIPMLFGGNPEEVLRSYQNCLSTEAVVEVSRMRAPA